MKRTIRRGVFETNSSSVHSLTICTESEYEAWEDGSMVFDNWEEKLIPKDEIEEGREIDNEHRYFDNPEIWFIKQYDYETYKSDYITPNGEKIVAFGYYGHD